MKMLLLCAALLAQIGCSQGQDEQSRGWSGVGAVWTCTDWTTTRALKLSTPTADLHEAIATSWIDGYVSASMSGRGVDGVHIGTINDAVDGYCSNHPNALLGEAAGETAKYLMAKARAQ